METQYLYLFVQDDSQISTKEQLQGVPGFLKYTL